MRMNERMKKVFSVLLCLCMLVQNAPVMAFAATTDNLCEHHTAHTAECGYAEAAAGSDCTHSHDGSCGYAEPVAEVLCTCEATDENGALVHTEGCGYVAPVTGADCTHNHDEHCGYAAPVEAKPCTYHCDICLGHDHDEEEQETTAPSSEATEPSSEATEPDPVCNCGTDDEAIHATNCPAYVAPENPWCYCAEKCTEDNVNIWCDVCGVQGVAACKGADEAAVYTDYYDLWIGDEQFTSEKLTITDANGGTATYDPTTNTLTLNNYTYAGPGKSNANGAIWYVSDASLKLVLEGTNSVTQQGTPENNSVMGFYSEKGSVTVSGTGSLTVKGGTAVQQSRGMVAYGGITVSDGASLTAESGTAGYSCGVDATVTVSGSGKLTAIGGTATDATDYDSCGVYGRVTVSDNGSLKATGGTAPNGKSYGVYAKEQGPITVSGGTVEAQGNDGAFDVVPTIAETHAVYGADGAVIEDPVWSELTYAKIAKASEPVPGYAVTISASENGTVTADPTTAAEGDTVTLTVTPAKGYQLGRLIVTNLVNTAEVITPTENEDGTYTFPMPAAAVTVSATFKACTHETVEDGKCTLCGVSGYKVSISGININFEVPDFVEKGKDCVAEIAEEDGYMLTFNLQVLVGGTAIDDFYMASGKLTIPAEQITGDIEIRASAGKNEDASNEHIYLGLPVFTWAEDHSCTATLTCARIGCTHSETDTCTVASEVTATSDCVTAAQTVYTATVTLNNKEFTDSETDTGEKDSTNHAKNTNTKYTPNEDGTTHSLVCDQCETAIQTGYHTGGTATCTEQAVCETCGEEYGDFAPDNHAQGCTLSYEVTEEGKHIGTYSLCKATFTNAHDFENAEHKCVCGVIETFQVFLFPDSLGMTTGTATFGVDFVQPITVPENTHLEIKGVYLDDDPSVPVSYTYENGILTIPAQGRPDGDITVDFFHYVEVTFHANGGVIKPEEGHPQDGWGYPEDGSYWIQKHGVSGYIHLANYAGMSRTGYTFKNEWRDENGTCYSHGDIASGAEVYSVYTDLTLYAQWQCLHTGEKNRTYENMGTYHNYVETCATCGENTDRGVMVEHDYDETTHSCVCGAIETFTITFNPANGEEKISITQDYGTPITAPELTYDGYHFVKWDTEVPETMPALDEEQTITAVWEAHSGGEATCETKAVCEICGTSYGNLADHSTSYTADGMTITYKCATCDTQTVTFTLVIPNGAVYGSSGLEVPHYDCSDKAYNGELPMITLDGKELKDFVPNAGTYAVTMTWGGQTVSGEYTIAPKELTEEDVTITLSPDSFLYDGSEKLPTVTIKKGDTTLVGGIYADGYTETNTNCDYRLVLPYERVKPGRWAITILFMNNYSGDAVVHYTITVPEAILSPDTPNVENDWHKDASLLAPSDYAISTTKDGTFGASLPLSDGTYENINYWLTYPDNENCEPVSQTWTGSIKVDGTAPTVSATAGSITDSTASITVTADDVLSGVASVTLTCADASVTIGALTDGAFPVSGMHPNRDYTFTLTAKDEAGNESDTTVELTTEKGDASVTKAPTANDLTYTGEAQPLLTAGVANGGTMQYSLDNQNWSADIPTGIDAKTYTVYYKVAGDSSHKDTVPACVVVTIAKANQEAPVGLTKTDEVIKGQKNGIITGLTNKMEYAVGDSRVYTAISGNQLENLAAGTYRVRYAADTNYNASPDAEVTIAEGKPITVKFADGTVHPVEGHYSLPANLTGGSYDAAITQPAAPADDTGDFVFLGWYTDAACADANAWDFAKTFDAANVEDSAFVQLNDHVEFTLYAKWKQIHFTISAGIIDSNGNAYTGNVDIQLVQGNQEIESQTNVNSPVTFGKHVDAGMYNIIVTYTDDDGEHTKTELITVDHDEAFTIKLPPAGANSHLTVSDNAQTPDVMVGGLDKEASDQKSGNDTVKVEMTVTGKTESQVADQVVNDVEEEVGDDTTVEYLDITVTKQVNNGAKTELSTTTNVLEIVVPYDGAGKDNLRVFRHHNGQLQEFVNGRDADGTFFFEGGYIHIFTKYFSNYMITYDVSHQITFNANGGTVSTASAQTKGDGTLTSLPTPAREGYVFKGWYTAASGGTKVTTSYVFSGDATIYAQWSGYTVTVADASNGTVSVDRAEAPGGTQVTITVTPKSGYKMATVTVKDANGSSRAVSTDNNGKYYFTMPNANVTVTVTFSKISTSTADPTNPKTGDNFQLVLWSGIMCGSAICLLVAFADQKRKLIK